VNATTANRRWRIAVDAMGSDDAPYPEVRGVLKEARSGDKDLILVGDREKLEAAVEKAGGLPENVTIVHASEAIGMQDQPMLAVRKKKDASLLVAIRLVKNGDADAVVSAGNTGAVMLASRTIFRPIPGVARSAIAQLLPTIKSATMLLDLGANVDCTARHLCDFAEMGVVYMRQIQGIKDPSVGLLNIGEEVAKGNELAKTVHRNLTAAPHINFIGNVEPRALFDGVADVVVCDGFVGNVVLKTSEGAGRFVKDLLNRELRATWLSKLGALLSMGAFRRLRRTVDPNEYPGAPLLGVNGVTIILHGACNAKGVRRAIAGAVEELKAEINEHIRTGIAELREAEAKLAENNSDESDVDAG
jgi:glycerol-3-phosphate acyltransferase PlsX